MSEEAATKVTLEKLSVKVADLRLKVAALEQELKDIDQNVIFSERWEGFTHYVINISFEQIVEAVEKVFDSDSDSD